MSARKTVVGTVTVHLDPSGYPMAFTDAAGNPVDCICQPGMRCEFHVKEMKDKATPVVTPREGR